MMRVRGFRRQVSVASSLLAIVVMVLTCWAGGRATANHLELTPTPDVANLPAGVEVVASAALDLAAGDYQWHVTTIMTMEPGDQPVVVHQGVLFADRDAVLVSHNDAALDRVDIGRALTLDEGESILPTGMSSAAVGLVLVELVPIVAPATPQPTETPGYLESMEIAPGSYVIALLHLPSSDQNDAAIEAIIAAAAGPITEVSRVGEVGTPEVANGERWLVALFAATGDEAATNQESGTGKEKPVPTGSSEFGAMTPTATGTATVTPPSTTGTTPTATALATMEPTLPPIYVETPTPIPGGLGSSSDTLEIGNDAPSLGGLTADTDGDGLEDVLEKDAGSNPNAKDSDGDGLQDGPEVDNRCSPLKPDTDDDGVPDDGEVLLYKTKCDDIDTDDDSLFDYDELFVRFSDPRLADTDGDGLGDYDEIINYDTGVRVPDSDADGWNDGYEAYTTGTNPLLVDSDLDCLSDRYESSIGTNPTATDSDGDGTRDGLELTVGTDPLDPESNNGGIMGDACDGTRVSR